MQLFSSLESVAYSSEVYASNCYYKISIRWYLLADILLHWIQDSISIPMR